MFEAVDYERDKALGFGRFKRACSRGALFPLQCVEPMTAAIWIRLVLFLLVSLVLLGGVRWYQRARQPSAEWARKLLHLGVGLLALVMPFLFHEIWPVLVVGLVYTLALALLRFGRLLREGPGQVLHSVSRTSLGEFSFVFAMCLIFLLAGDNTILYVIPLMILATADVAAAVVGVQYGRVRYDSEEGRLKSVEGSVAFFVVAFFCVHVPLLLFTNIGRLESLLLAAILAFMVMLAEAVSWNGLDNLIVPVVSFILLRWLIDETAAELALHLVVIVALASLVRVWRKRTTLAADALMGAVIFGYVVWVIGGWRWLLPPVLVFSTYTFLSQKIVPGLERVFHVRVLLAVSSGALVWLTLYTVLRTPQLFYAFVAALAANLSIITLVRQKHAAPATSPTELLARNCANGALILLPSTLVMAGFTLMAPVNFLLGLLAVLAAIGSFYIFQPSIEAYPVDLMRWLRQALAAGLSSVLPLAPLLLDASYFA